MQDPDRQLPGGAAAGRSTNPKKAVYYPFAEFSPEWQAIKYGLSNQIPVRFMDLPQAYQLANQKAWKPQDQPTENSQPSLPMKDPLTWLAETAGYSDGRALVGAHGGAAPQWETRIYSPLSRR